MAAINRWWDESVLPGVRPIGPADLRLAEKRRKPYRVIRPMPKYADLLTGLRANPEAFRDRRLFVWVFKHSVADRCVDKALEEARTKFENDAIECWQDLAEPPPPSSYVIGFDSEANPPKFDGMWRILADQPIYEPARKQGKLLLCTKATSFDGLKLGSTREWRLAAAVAAAGGADGWEASEFAKLFLRNQS